MLRHCRVLRLTPLEIMYEPLWTNKGMIQPNRIRATVSIIGSAPAPHNEKHHTDKIVHQTLKPYAWSRHHSLDGVTWHAIVVDCDFRSSPHHSPLGYSKWLVIADDA